MTKIEDWNDLGIARVHLKVTQQQMAEAIGVGYRTYQNWERHISKPTEFTKIEVMAKVNKMLSNQEG